MLRKPKQKFLAIDVCGPTIENGIPTTIRLIHKNFFLLTKESVMQAVVDELQPLIKGNLEAALVGVNIKKLVGEGLLQGQYVFNISLLIGFYRKLWYSYEKPNMIVAKTILLMLLAGVLNILGVLLIAVPFDNFNMSRNLRAVGWSKTATNVTYGVLTFPAYIFWSVYLVRWATK